jgi:hypothetical protein
MPITISRLVSAPVLQNAILDDQTGLPLANGIIWLYQDNARTTPKNWYYQSGTAGNYTYIPLPNPLTLNAAGAITDNNGNDTDPFYYPYAEQTVGDIEEGSFQPYYITVQDQFGAQKFIRQNFPFISQGMPVPAINQTFKNYLVNGEFWRNIAPNYSASVPQSFNATVLPNQFSLNGVPYNYATVAPSQHDGFSMPDMIFVKDVNGVPATTGVDLISFQQFPLGSTVLQAMQVPGAPIPNSVTPKWYFNLQCTAQGTESYKYIQWPIALNVQNFTNLNGVFTFWAQNLGVNGEISVFIIPFLGTGVISPVQQPLRNISLNDNWEFYQIPFPFPNMMGLTLASSSSTGGPSDDAWYIQIRFPIKLTCNINIAFPKLYLGTVPPTNDFDDDDQINAIISSSRTGDIKISNSSYMFGYVPANDGTIGNYASNATTLQSPEVFQLYQLLWNIAQPYDSGSDSNPICQMYTSLGAKTNFSAAGPLGAVTDFNANKQLQLTSMFGRVMAGTIPASALLPSFNNAIVASNSGGNLLISGNGNLFYQGQPVSFTTTGTLPDSIVANAIYYVTNIASSTFNLAISYTDAITGTPVVAWVSSAGSGTVIHLNVQGAEIGEYGHILTRPELPDPLTTTAGQLGTTSAGTNFVANTASHATATVSNQGGNQPHNNVQPLTFYNIFFKL